MTLYLLYLVQMEENNNIQKTGNLIWKKKFTFYNEIDQAIVYYYFCNIFSYIVYSIKIKIHLYYSEIYSKCVHINCNS